MKTFDENDPDLPQNYDEIIAFLKIYREMLDTDTLRDFNSRWDERREEMRS